MTKERFKEMLRALLEGNAIELQSDSDPTVWIPVVIDNTLGQFNICLNNNWYPCAIGGPGVAEWRHIGPHENGLRMA